MAGEIFKISGLIIGLTCTILIFVILKFGSKKIHYLWAAFNCTVGIWGYGCFLITLADNASKAMLLWKVTLGGATLSPIVFYHVTAVVGEFKRKWQLRTFYFYAILFWFLCLFNLAGIKPNYIYNSFYYVRATDSRWALLVSIWTSIIFYAIYELYGSYRKSLGKKRVQLFYLLIGYAVGFSGALLDTLPFFGLYIFPFHFGNIFIWLYCLIVAYAIVRHHLMDIEVIVKKTLVFTGLSASLLGMIIILSFILQDIVGRFIAMPKALSYTLMVIVAVILYEPIKNFLVNITNKYLFQKKYDPRQVIRSFIDYIATALDLDKIVSGTVDLLEKNFHPSSLSILLSNGDKDRYIQHGIKNAARAILINYSSSISRYLKTVKNILSIENDNDKKMSEEIKNELLTYKATIAVPLILRDELIGIILLGKKKSDEYYTIDDLSMLMDLARTLAIAISNSISHSLLLEAQKKQAQSERLVSMGYLVTNLSHEIRNPINNISVAAQDALDEIELNLSMDDISDQKHKDSISFVKGKLNDAIEKSNKANAVFNSILNIMKIDKRKFTPLSIKKIIDEDISRIEPYIKENNINVLNLIPDDFPSFKGDEIIIEQAFFNLINNAVQAIVISHAGDRVEIRAHDAGDRVHIEVDDNSCGIPKYDVDRIFEPFYTTKDNLHVYATGKSKGIGIGLMITHHIITAHDGTITVKSKEGKGTTFIVEIPKEAKIGGE